MRVETDHPFENRKLSDPYNSKKPESKKATDREEIKKCGTTRLFFFFFEYFVATLKC